MEPDDHAARVAGPPDLRVTERTVFARTRLREREPARKSQHAEVAAGEDSPAEGIAPVHPGGDVASPSAGLAVGRTGIVAIDDADVCAA